jgi:hypothetical protein
MQHLILLICLINTLTSYRLASILKSIYYKIDKRYYSEDSKNWISMDSAHDINYYSDEQIMDILFNYRYARDDRDWSDFIRAEVTKTLS